MYASVVKTVKSVVALHKNRVATNIVFTTSSISSLPLTSWQKRRKEGGLSVTEWVYVDSPIFTLLPGKLLLGLAIHHVSRIGKIIIIIIIIIALEKKL